MNRALFRIVSKYWFTSVHTYLITLVLPVVLYFISTRVTNMFNSNASYLALPGALLLVGVASGVIDLAVGYYEFRKTSFARQLHLLKGSSSQLILILVIINLFASLIGSVWLFFIAYLTYQDAMHLDWINWFSLIWAICLGSILSSFIGILIALISKDLKVIIVSAILVFLVFAFLSGLFFPIGVIRSDKILTVSAYFFPISYCSSIMGSSFFWSVPNWILESNLYPNLTFFDDLHNLWLPTLIVFGWIFICLSVIWGLTFFQDR